MGEVRVSEMTVNFNKITRGYKTVIFILSTVRAWNLTKQDILFICSVFNNAFSASNERVMSEW
jgi:hypothetical protein